MSQVHFEIFRRQGARGGWTLHEIVSGRELALEIASALMASEQATGVKVVKETYNEDTGDYLSLKIFEDGHNQMKVEPAAEDTPHALPCFKPDDLYSYHARATITRLINDFLSRQKITVTELIHRADLLERFEATGTLYQHAVQKIAVAQASSTTMPVQQIVKSLNELVTKTIHRVYRDARNNYFPQTPPGEFGALATRLAESGDGKYVFNGAIALHLADAKGWDDKLSRLLALLKEAPADEKPRALLLSSVDAIVAEILNGSAALHELMGPRENLGEALLALTYLFLGKTDGAGSGVEMLAERFAKDELQDARSAIANRILAELKSSKRLSHGAIMEELKLLRRVANTLVLAQGKYLAHEDIIAAFTLRSRRLINNETINEHLDGAATPDEKLERLLMVEENIIGQENKRNLGAFVIPIITSAAFETRFLQGKTTPMSRLARLAELQGRVRRSTFQDIQRREICDILDKFACRIEAQIKLFDNIESKSSSPVEKAISVLKLFTGNVLTEGNMSARGREIILSCLGKPGFLTGYTAHLPQAADGTQPTAEAAMNDLTEHLKKAGITTETGLRSIAA
ncbi:MAG TPA: hypothetical protein VHD95_14900 [Rhizomicrobium sp.]|jgi:hypothetical protein|nr:hypothetical protein [Rhizomicrobium sp.]